MTGPGTYRIDCRPDAEPLLKVLTDAKFFDSDIDE
jgi:hypothetical protein